MTFSARLKQLREEANLNQTELGKIVGVSRSAIAMYEAGEREPDFEVEEALADFFNVPIDYLRGREKEKPPVIDGGQWGGAVKTLTPHEERVILAYRAQPALQAAVDKLLDVEEATAPSQSETA